MSGWKIHRRAGGNTLCGLRGLTHAWSEDWDNVDCDRCLAKKHRKPLVLVQQNTGKTVTIELDDNY